MDRSAAQSADARGSARLISPRPALERIGAAVFVAGLIGFSAWYLAPAIFRSWFFSSDEYVVVGETIRFAHLDFRQHYFDQPETPLMLVTAALWDLTYGAARLAGRAPAGLDDFTLRHVARLFEIGRIVSFLPGLIAIALMYVLASRLTNRAGGCVAAAILAMCPAFTEMESLIRPEPLCVCLFLVSLLCLLRGLETPDAATQSRWICATGLSAGVAAATRFHSITATLPLLLMILIAGDRPSPAYPAWVKIYWKRILALAFAGALAAMIGIRIGLLQRTIYGRMLTTIWPKGFDTLFPLCALAAALLAAIWLLRFGRRTAWISERIVSPQVFILISATLLGALAGTPTILWRRQDFFTAIQMYTTVYIDPERLHWTLWHNLQWLFSYYMKAVARDNFSLTLMAIGAALIILRLDRKLAPFLINAVLFFVFRPVNTRVAPHQVLLWLPMFAILAGYGVALAYDWMTTLRFSAILAPAALAGLLIALVSSMKIGPRIAAAAVAESEMRLRSVALAADWMHLNADPGATLAISYFCFNPDVFFTWMRSMDVPLPSPAADAGNVLIWWGEHSALAGRRGYACATPVDIKYIKGQVDLLTPGQGSDPYAEAGFGPVQTFGAGSAEVDVFRFDFSRSAANSR